MAVREAPWEDRPERWGAEQPGAVRDAERGAGETLGFGRAAEELGLTRRELELAIRFEEVRAVPAAGAAGRPRVPLEEVSRLWEEPGFPEALRERLRLVGTAQGAELLGVGQSRFSRLARAGLLTPAKFYVNRYRAVVWLYRVPHLREFAVREPSLLIGSLPARLRAGLDAGDDWRARNWRGGRVGELVRQADGPWERAAVPAAVLPADQIAEVVGDPYERALLRGLRPELVPPRAESMPSWPVVERLITAADPDEILWYRTDLHDALAEARAALPAPRPEGSAPPGPVTTGAEPGPGSSPGTSPCPRPYPGPGVDPDGGARAGAGGGCGSHGRPGLSLGGPREPEAALFPAAAAAPAPCPALPRRSSRSRPPAGAGRPRGLRTWLSRRS